MGYTKMDKKILNSSDFGLPAHKRRFFLVAFKGDLKGTDKFTWLQGDPQKTLALTRFLGSKRALAKKVACCIRVGGRNSPADGRHAWDVIKWKDSKLL